MTIFITLIIWGALFYGLFMHADEFNKFLFVFIPVLVIFTIKERKGFKANPSNSLYKPLKYNLIAIGTFVIIALLLNSTPSFKKAAERRHQAIILVNRAATRLNIDKITSAHEFEDGKFEVSGNGSFMGRGHLERIHNCIEFEKKFSCNIQKPGNVQFTFRADISTQTVTLIEAK